MVEVEELLAQLTTDAQTGTALGDELFAVAGLLATQAALRRALTDPSRTAAARSGPRDNSADGQGQRADGPADRGCGRGQVVRSRRHH